MTEENVCTPPTPDDLRAALRDMQGYVDITEDDLNKIYQLALRHARMRGVRKTLVQDAMLTDVISARPTTDLADAAQQLSDHRISGMPVLDTDGRVVGVISEADILKQHGMQQGHTFKDLLRRILGGAVQQGAVPMTVGGAMSSPAITIGPASTMADAARILDQRRIKRIPVVDVQGRLLGLISRAIIVRELGQHETRNRP